jgi:enoyl-[acyl-carrier protein] reductase I
MLLAHKKVLVTGVVSEASIATSVARLVQEQGADIVLTSFGRAFSLTQRIAKRLPRPADVVELDVTRADHLSALAGELGRRWDRVDAVLHAIGYAPPVCLSGDFMAAGWEDVGTALHVSAYSLKALAEATLPLMKESGGAIVGLDFDASRAWPSYDWMGVAKAALESTTRYLARDLGRYRIRVNLVSAGPVRTLAARGVPGFAELSDAWSYRAPLAWEPEDASPVARACAALLSDWFPATTGEIVHVDGGFHAMGA